MPGIRYPQSVVGIAGSGATLTIRTRESITVEVLDAPDGVRPHGGAVTGSGEVTVRLSARSRVERGTIRLRVTGGTDGTVREVSLPVRIWGPRMSFICLAQSSNRHAGWDPRPMAQYYRRDDDELVTYDSDDEGNHAWVHARKLERIFHKWGTPITWLIDDTVAAEQASQISAWHAEFGDAVAYLPRSYFYFNKRNYNLTHRCDEIAEIIRPEIDRLETAFADADWPVYCRTMGADQWVGSPGTGLVAAARALGFSAQWGIGYDHDTCDTSMYHKGTPWDVYKPRDGDFRVPGAAGDFWLFQWTTRDLLNTSYFAPRVGSTTFSTDADDIKYNGIPRFQMDYYARLLEEYRRNLSHHDVNVFLVHQEDHDSHIHESNRVLEAFVDQVHELETFATMDEIVAWLNCRYAPEEHPCQLIEMNDPLTCHAQMKHASAAGDIPSRFAENESWAREGKANPPHVAYYGSDMLWIFEEGANVPKIFYNYARSGEYEFVEDGEYPTEPIPEIAGLSLDGKRVGNELELRVSFDSSDAVECLPVAVWHESLFGLVEGLTSGRDASGSAVRVWRTERATVVHIVGVQKGRNERVVSITSDD